MILRERPLTFTLILAMMLLSLQIFPEACAAQPKPIVEATQRAILEREGSGSVFFNSSIRIMNPSDTSSMSLPEFTIGYPSETARNIVYFKATSGDTTLDVVIEETANSTSYKINLGELSQIPASSSINLGFTAYAHSLIKNLEPKRFSATIPDFPSFDVSVDIVNATVELPRNPDLESYPSEYDVMEKDELNLVRRDVLPETLRLSTFVFTYPEEVSGIQLLYSNVTRNYYLRLDGNLHVRDDLTFLNRGTDEILTFDIIKYFYPNGSSAFEAQTVLGRALKVEKIGDFIDLSPPFKINQGESFRIILEYDQTNMFRPEGFLLLNQKYDLEVESSIPYLVENFIINVNPPVGSSDSWVFEDTSRHTRYKVTGEISFTVFQGINFIFRPVFLLFLV
nr:hypothetical protein [Nitrososphaeria archaeon]NIQ34209.1 hypothetical protein [Nitrososphaeria archaeon]